MNIANEINLALKQFSLGNKENAYKKLKKIFNKNKNDHQLRFNLAVIQQSLNLNQEAKKNYKFLIDINFNYKALVNLYLLYINEGKFLDALFYLDKLIDSNNDSDSIIKDKAFVLYKLNQFNESINICEKFLKKQKDINFFNILGLNYLELKQYETAKEFFEQGLAINKNSAIILNSLGRLYHETRDSKNAEIFFIKAYKIENDSYEIINNLAGFYREETEYKKSIELYEKALKINPQNPSIVNNLAKVYFDIEDLEMAEKYCLRAYKMDSNDGNITKILSLIYLRKQNYKLGWSFFDGRLNLSDFIEKNSTIKSIREKLLKEREKLNKNSNILVLREQGVGDEILYGTMYNDLFKNFNNVTIECDPRLKNILCNSFPKEKNRFVNIGLVSKDEKKLEEYDTIIYAGSLGKIFRNKIEDFDDGCYLSVDNEIFRKTKKELKVLANKINIGISWKSFKNRYSDEKSLTLEDFNNIFKTKNCNFINLQYGKIEKEVKDYNDKFNKNIITIDNLDLFNDFDKLACVLKNLDLFITVSNSTAHLAGALGVKTLLIRPNNHAVFHYWNQPGLITPWYKSISFLDKSKLKNENDIITNYLNI